MIQVLLQGVFMRGDNCTEMLDRIRTGVTQLELSLAAGEHTHTLSLEPMLYYCC